MKVAAPAKLNLGLRIVGRREDGYHLIESLFVPLELADEIQVELGPGAGLELDLAGEAAGVPADDGNLALRAARAFLAAARLERGATLRLEKRIPVAAGLGGGSSDAAAVLRALDALLPGSLPPARLRSLALELGADVPYFLDPQPARVSGVGECIEPVAGLPALPVVLLSPGIPLATAEVYRAFDERAGELTPAGADPTMALVSALRESEGGIASEALEGLLENELEPVAGGLCPAVGELRRLLAQEGARAVGMSGSGPTVYGVFEDRAAAARAEARLRPEPPGRSLVTATLASP